MTLTSEEVRELAGVPETRLPVDAAAALPESTPGAPWRVQMSALMWRHRSKPEAAEAVPSALVAKSGGITNAGFVKYAETPVGPYSEVMSAVSVQGGMLPRVHIPFIAVDSLSSVQAGRTHWALPKVPASFTWRGAESAHADGDGWWLSARVVHTGPRIPLFGRSTNVQVRPDGRTGLSSTGMHGWARVVTVQVHVDPNASFASWVAPGRHRGVLVTHARLSMGAARWSSY
ncbi:MAG: acetoacetate decarboxylase family protein [Actinomycetes bacterium]